MIQIGATTPLFSQAVRDDVKDYICERGMKLRFATTW